MCDESSCIALIAGGVLGALTNVALGSRVLVLPRVDGHRIHLGFLGQLIICVGVACAVDHDFQTAFFSSLCGTSLLRYVKHRIESHFGDLEKELGESDD